MIQQRKMLQSIAMQNVTTAQHIAVNINTNETTMQNAAVNINANCNNNAKSLHFKCNRLR